MPEPTTTAPTTTAPTTTAPSTTPSQTIGPFFHPGLRWTHDPVPENAVAVTIRVFDGADEPVADGLVETWQADADGGFPASGFRRCPADADGVSTVRTVKPASLPAEDGARQAPHLDVSIFCRGLLDRVITRLYFDDETAANRADPVLASLGAQGDRLVARTTDRGYHLDIHLQGPAETPFFVL